MIREDTISCSFNLYVLYHNISTIVNSNVRNLVHWWIDKPPGSITIATRKYDISPDHFELILSNIFMLYSGHVVTILPDF